MGALFWAILSGIMAILEIIIPGLVTIWFALSALIVMFLSNFIGDSLTQFLIFSVISIVFLIFTRPVLRKYIELQRKTDFDSSMKGMDVKVERVVDARKAEKEYEVKFKGSIWTGVSEEMLSSGEVVKIKGFRGNKIILEKNK
ncbi:NfeD family protein [uncultured Leptotrichia sp.]|uniref:NfeD family protein n=1 Tax=uncultured Leptotrichia sp. TaxID=159271 RepID=UPI0025CEDCBA|nr:NfeD family protein [uncultured Leptotrichia sp.]